MPLLTDNIPDTSWLHGKYSWYVNSNKVCAEINTKLPYVSLPHGEGEDFFAQGEEADKIIEEIHALWIKDGRTTTKTATMKWCNLYL